MGGQKPVYYLAPSGDFGVVDSVGVDAPAVMLGLQATEYLSPTGAGLRFIPGRPAYAPLFPVPQDPDARQNALSAAATTAWVMPVDAAAPSGYFAQPPQSVYFGHANPVSPRMLDVVPVRVGEYGTSPGTRPCRPRPTRA